MRPSSPLLDSVRDQFEDYDQLAKDFTRVFLNDEPSCLTNAHLFDVVFLVGQSKQKARLIGVRAILGVRSRVFQVGTQPCLWIYLYLYLSLSNRKCFMAFRRALDHRRYQLPRYLPDLPHHSSRRRIKSRRATTIWLCPTRTRYDQRVCPHRRWWSGLSLGLARSPLAGADPYGTRTRTNWIPTIKRSGSHQQIVRVRVFI